MRLEAGFNRGHQSSFRWFKAGFVYKELIPKGEGVSQRAAYSNLISPQPKFASSFFGVGASQSLKTPPSHKQSLFEGPRQGSSLLEFAEVLKWHLKRYTRGERTLYLSGTVGLSSEGTLQFPRYKGGWQGEAPGYNAPFRPMYHSNARPLGGPKTVRRHVRQSRREQGVDAKDNLCADRCAQNERNAHAMHAVHGIWGVLCADMNTRTCFAVSSVAVTLAGNKSPRSIGRVEASAVVC